MEKSSNNENPEAVSEPILKEGMVWKRGRKVTSTWKRRYFVLRPSTLSYHLGVESTNDNERRFIQITQNSTVTHRPDKHSFCFQVWTPGYRTITSRCESEEEMSSWITAIEECISRAPAWPIKCCVVGEEEEPTFGKQVMVTHYLNACKGKSADGETVIQNPYKYTQVNKAKTRVVKTPDEFGNLDIMWEYEKDAWVKLMLWNLDGRDQFAKLRSLSYPHSDMYIVVFSVSDFPSFEKVDLYMKEIRASVKAASSDQNPLFLIVGTRLSRELVQVGFNQAEQKARELGANGYVECRLDSEEECEQVFADAIRLIIEKQVTVYASTTDPDPDPGRLQSSNRFLSSLKMPFLKRKGAESVADESPENSPSSAKTRSRGFFRSATRTVQLEKTVSGRTVEKVVDDGEEAEDSEEEGSLIGVEVEESEQGREERDFGFDQLKEDPAYTQKVLSRATSGGIRRPGDISTKMSSSELFDIHETPAEEREKELHDLRKRDAKREKELNHMKSMMDSLQTHNRIVEEQLSLMRTELAALTKQGTPFPTFKIPVSCPSPQLSSTETESIPSPERSPTQVTSPRNYRSASVFF